MHLNSNKNTNFYYFISRNMILIELKITVFYAKKMPILESADKTFDIITEKILI